MKFILHCIVLLLLINEVVFVKIRSRNPDEVLADSNGGDNGEFVRRNQPQEHLIIPLINSLEAEYAPNIDIRKYREEMIKELNQNKIHLLNNNKL